MGDRARLDAIFRDVLELEPDVELPELRFRHTAGWDSVAHIQLLLAIEEAFGIAISAEDASAMLDFESACGVVERADGDGSEQVDRASDTDR